MTERIVYQVSLKQGKISAEDPNWNFKITKGTVLYLEKEQYDRLHGQSKIHLTIGEIIKNEEDIKKIEGKIHNITLKKEAGMNEPQEKDKTKENDGSEVQTGNEVETSQEITVEASEPKVEEAPVKKEEKNVEEAEKTESSEEEINVQKIEPAPEPKVEAKKEILPITVDMMRQGKKAIDIGIIGAGQGGSRIAESFFKLGYPNACVINTARQDLHYINLPDENKLLLEYTKGGVGKSLDLGTEAIQAYEKEVFELMEEIFVNEVDMILVTIGGGGGSGSGAAETLVKLANRFELPVNVLITIPKHSEDTTTEYNALVTLDRMAKLATSGAISGLIVVDNARIQSKYPSITEKELWTQANHDITSTLDMFNKLCYQPTDNVSLDSMDFARIFVDTNSCIIYGHAIVTEFYNEQALASSLIESLKTGLLAEGFDLKETVNAGVIITHHPSVALSSSAVDYAFQMLNEAIGAATVFRGLYAVEDDNVTPNQLVVHVICSGLGIPRSRIDQMMEKNRGEMEELETKRKNTAKMTVFDDTTSIQNEAHKYSNMKRQHSSFGKIGKRGRKK